MYLNALEFLEEEREAWRPFEALAALTDEQLSFVPAGAHGWAGRDLMGHLVAWQQIALGVATELAVNETSRTMQSTDEQWATQGDAMNDRMVVEWRQLPMDEVRRRFREVPGELRGYLTVVPETRWVKHVANLRYFTDETTGHYANHAADLQAILDAAG